MTSLRAILLLLAIPLQALPSASAAPAPPLLLETKIPLGEVRGRIDHLAADPGRHRLFVAELGNDSLAVVDLARGRVAQRITGLRAPQDVAYIPAADLVYVTDGGDGSALRLAGGDLAPAGRIELGADADNIRLEPGDGRLAVGYGAGALALLDAASGRQTATLALPGHPEAFQFERQGPRIFVNVPDAHAILVVDRDTGRQVGSWGLADAKGNFPMALDAAGDRLIVAYRHPATLAVFASRDGAVLARAKTCGDADDVALDARRQRLYVSCGEGRLAILALRPDGLEELARLPTAAGARTALFVPELDRLYLAVRASRGEPAAIWVFRPGEP